MVAFDTLVLVYKEVSFLKKDLFLKLRSSVDPLQTLMFNGFVSEYAEADSFFCFTNLMSEIRDNFIKTLDDSQCGIGKQAKISKVCFNSV